MYRTAGRGVAVEPDLGWLESAGERVGGHLPRRHDCRPEVAAPVTLSFVGCAGGDEPHSSNRDELVMDLGLQAVVALVARIALDAPSPRELVRLPTRIRFEQSFIGSAFDGAELPELRPERASHLAPRSGGGVAFGVVHLTYLRADQGRRRRPMVIAESIVEHRLQLELPVAAEIDRGRLYHRLSSPSYRRAGAEDDQLDFLFPQRQLQLREAARLGNDRQGMHLPGPGVPPLGLAGRAELAVGGLRHAVERIQIARPDLAVHDVAGPLLAAGRRIGASKSRSRTIVATSVAGPFGKTSFTIAATSGSSRPMRSLASGNAPTASTTPPARWNSSAFCSVEYRTAFIAGNTSTR